MNDFEGYHELPPGMRFPTPGQRLFNRRRGWYVQLAEEFDLVPHPTRARVGVFEMVAHLRPGLFESRSQFGNYSGRRPFDIVAAQWGQDFHPVDVQLLGGDQSLPLLVHRQSLAVAERHALNLLPPKSQLKG